MDVTLRLTISKFFLILVLIFNADPSQAALCKRWSKPSEVGRLSTSQIDEQSGVAASVTQARLYHNNDSGDFAKIYVTDLSGKLLSTVQYSDQIPLDVEDLGYGKCDAGRSKNCLYVGDIGDNLGIRPAVMFHVIEEQNVWPEKVRVLRTLYVRFPDGVHDAESFAIHPNGDLILITKEYSKKLAQSANVYRLEAKKVFAGGAHFFTKIGTLDVPKMIGSDKAKEGVVTSMSIAPDGKTFLVLTYIGVLEINFDFSRENLPSPLRAGTDYQTVSLQKLEQMEAITHSADGKSFFYSSESSKKNGVPLMNVRCLTN